jgi:hypothetical protein
MKGRHPFGGTLVAFLSLGLLAPAGAWAKVGLGARFGDVILEGAKPGQTYSLREASRVPFAIENRGDAATDVVIEFERPARENLAPDYALIPDPSWFKAVPDRLSLAPHGMGFCDILLTIPDDPALVGKSYQVAVWGRSVSTGGSVMGAAVQGRIRVSIGPGPDSIKEEKRQKAMQQLDFDVSPKDLFLVGVPVGKPWDAKKEAKKSIRVANYAPDKLVVVFAAEKWDRRNSIPAGYEEIPEPSWIKLVKATVSVAQDEIGQASLVVDVPDKPENRGKKWVAMLRPSLATGYWLDAPVKLFVETLP